MIKFIEMTATGSKNWDIARNILLIYGFRRFGAAKNFEVWKNGLNVFVLNFDFASPSGQFARKHGGLVLTGIGLDSVPYGLQYGINVHSNSYYGLPVAFAPGDLAIYFDAGRLWRSFLAQLSLDTSFVEPPVLETYMGWDHIDVRTETPWDRVNMVEFFQKFGLTISHLVVNQNNLVVAAQDKTGTRIALPHPVRVGEEVIRRIPGIYLDHAAISPLNMEAAVATAVQKGGVFTNPKDVLPGYYDQLRQHPYAHLLDVVRFEKLGIRAASWEENEGNLLVQAYSEPLFPINANHAYTSPTVLEFAYRLGEGAEQQEKIFPVRNPATQAIFAATTKTQVGDGE